MRYLAFIVGTFLAAVSSAKTNQEIMDQNAKAIVYLQVEDATGGILDHGSGFIVSGDGYVVTAAHLKVGPGQNMIAVMGQRSGTRLSLLLREADDLSDVALWQLPQSPDCYNSVTLSTATVSIFDPVMALGFPTTGGMTPTPLKIANLTSPRGFYKGGSLLQGGDSGAPVFNEDGKVIAIVQGGTLPGTDNNDLVPIAHAISLITKWGVQAGINTSVSCDLHPHWDKNPLISQFPNPPFGCSCVNSVVPSLNSFPLENGLPTAPYGTTAKLTNNCNETISALFIKTVDRVLTTTNSDPPTMASPGRFYALGKLQPGQAAVVDFSGLKGAGIILLNCPNANIVQLGPPDKVVQWYSTPPPFPQGQIISCGCVPLVGFNRAGVAVAPPGTQAQMENHCSRRVSIVLVDDTQMFPLGPPPPQNTAPGRRFTLVELEDGQKAKVDLSGSVYSSAACVTQ